MGKETKIVSPSQVIGLTFSNPPLSFRGSEEGKIIHARLIREVDEKDGQFISSPDHPGIARILNQYPTRPLFREKLRTVPVSDTTSLRARPDLATPDVCVEIKPGPPTYRNLLQACLGTMVLTPQGRGTDGAVYTYQTEEVILIPQSDIKSTMRKQIIALVTTAAEFVRLEKQEDLITGKRKKKKNPFQGHLGLTALGLDETLPINRDEIRKQKIECRRDFDAILPEIREGLLRVAIKIKPPPARRLGVSFMP